MDNNTRPIKLMLEVGQDSDCRIVLTSRLLKIVFDTFNPAKPAPVSIPTLVAAVEALLLKNSYKPIAEKAHIKQVRFIRNAANRSEQLRAVCV
jgi:hypothetical protein